MLLLATVVLVLLAAPQAWAEEEEDDIYKKIFDDVDVDSILNNDRILDTYLKCFFNTGPCSNLAETMKGKIPEVFSTVCGRCTDKQKQILRHCLHVFIPKRPDDWKKILEIYDPEGKYWPGIKAFMDEDPNA
uniref:Chemosensory protein 10 n=1 Tax=Riptortus pedestris TaxID=329032 RepID=A0A2Z4HQ05_RIPPE|nr:chemosensory protein 10 [Riptortus pedestris]